MKRILLYERRETWRVRIGRDSPDTDCSECGDVEWLPVIVAANFLGINEQELHLLATEGEIHLWTSGSEETFVCSRSLSEQGRKRQR